MSDVPRRGAPGDLLPWEKRWDEPRSTPQPQLSDNAVTERPLLYGPTGEVLIKSGPRSIGFRKP